MNSRVSKMTLFFVLLGIIGVILSGCGNSTSEVSSGDSTSEVSIGGEWNCKSSTEGIGETYSCSTQSVNEENTVWTLTLTCSADLLTRHTLLGLESNADQVQWKSGAENIGKIRIDSGLVEEVRFGTKDSGGALVFGDFTKAYTNEAADETENKESWNLLDKISNAKDFGFQVYDASGALRKGNLEFSNTKRVVTKFESLGCKR
jgi:hypothetical protein